MKVLKGLDDMTADQMNNFCKRMFTWIESFFSSSLHILLIKEFAGAPWGRGRCLKFCFNRS